MTLDGFTSAVFFSFLSFLLTTDLEREGLLFGAAAVAFLPVVVFLVGETDFLVGETDFLGLLLFTFLTLFDLD